MLIINSFPSKYFWRTKDQSEIDYIEENNGGIKAFEFKYSSDKKVRFPKSFIDSYMPSETIVINKSNFWEWIIPKKYMWNQTVFPEEGDFYILKLIYTFALRKFQIPII